MGRSSPKLDFSFTYNKEEKSVTFRNNIYKFRNPQSDGSGNFRCNVKGCLSNIRINRNKTKILGGTYDHDHSSLDTSVDSSQPQAVQTKPFSKRGSDVNKLSPNLSPLQKLTSITSNEAGGSASNVNESASSPVVPTNTQRNSLVPNPHDASHINHISELDVSSPTSIESTSTTKSSEASSEIDENNVTILKSQMREMKLLHNSLIDKIMEKELIILNQGSTIESLKREVADLEYELKKKSTSISDGKKRIQNNGDTFDPDSKESTSTSNQGTNIPNTTIVQKPISNNGSQKKIIENKSEIHTVSLLGDSHCRGLGFYLRRFYDKVEIFFKPGGGFVEIKDTHTSAMLEASKDDKIIYFCGTNDIQDRNWSKVFSAVDEILSRYSPNNLCFVLVPIRWDRPYLNTSVQKFNNKLREKLRDKNISYLDPNYFLRPWHYAVDGLHLNIKGKRLVGLKLKDHLEKVSKFSNQPILEPNLNCLSDNHCSLIMNSHLSNSNDRCNSNSNSSYMLNNQTPSTSFIYEQSYTYDLHHLALINSTLSSLSTPTAIPIIDTTRNVSPCESTFSTTPNFQSKEVEMKET